MESMGALLGSLVVLALVGPVALLLLGMAAMALAGALPTGSPSVARASFQCPFSRRAVSAEFLARAGDEQAFDVLSCSAFKDPHKVLCQKNCLALMAVRATSAALMPRYSLVADGGVAYRAPRGA